MSTQEASALEMSSGPLTRRLLRFALPVMFTGILQLLYNAADIVVVGQFGGGHASVAAVGSTGALVNLLVNLFMGVSVGANFLAAKLAGAKDTAGLRRCIHCAVGASVIIGVLAGIVGFFTSTPLLRLMDSPEDVLPLSSLYLKIYFLGMPALVVYNFGAAILRALGDTKRPLVYMAISGMVNVVLNLFFVCVCKLDVAGVAIATSVSQFLSAFLVLRCLTKRQEEFRLVLREIRLHKEPLVEMLRTGIPAGLQGVLFSLSNVIVQSAINPFGSAAMAGNSAASSLEGFIYTALNAFYQATLTFISHNLGAKNYHRILQVFWQCLAMVAILGISLCGLLYLFHDFFLGLYISPEDGELAQVLETGRLRIGCISIFQFLGGFMEIGCGGQRGLGRTWLPTLVTFFGSCALRIIWVHTVFSSVGTLESLYISYPISWALTFLVHCACFFPTIYRKMRA